MSRAWRGFALSCFWRLPCVRATTGSTLGPRVPSIPVSAEIDQASARPDDPAEEPRSPGDRRRALYPLLLLAPPMLWMVAIVLGGTRMQYNDYWQMIDGTLREDGWLDIGGLFEFQNEHPVVIAKILFWFNWLLTGGSNITLGLVVITIVAVEGLILSRFVDEPERRTRVGLAVVAAAGVLLFSRQGIHNFFQAMSGAAWFTANLFALAAILARVRERTVAGHRPGCPRLDLVRHRSGRLARAGRRRHGPRTPLAP